MVLLDTDVETVPDVSAIEGRLAQFAARRRFARAFRRHVGGALALGGRRLQRVDDVGTASDRFVVFSDQPAEASRRLTPERLAAIRQVWSAWADIGVTQPWIGLCGDRIVIAGIAGRPTGIAQVAALVEAGAALAGA
jgi:hypothetical protein